MQSLAQTATALPLKDICVLIVEDMPDELRLLARILVDAGARVLMAVEGAEALRLATIIRPDVVVLDVQLPPPDGIAICRALGAHTASANIPVLLTSGLLNVQTRLDGFAAGARDFITKPFTAPELVARVALHANLGRQLRLSHDECTRPRWLTAVLQRLQAALADPPTVETLAQEAGTTTHRLHDAFRTHLNTTPAAFVRGARLNEAARQLRDSTTTVAEVSLALGYASPANFATVFRDRFGVSPRQYRQGLDAPLPAGESPP